MNRIVCSVLLGLGLLVGSALAAEEAVAGGAAGCGAEEVAAVGCHGHHAGPLARGVARRQARREHRQARRHARQAARHAAWYGHGYGCAGPAEASCSAPAASCSAPAATCAGSYAPPAPEAVENVAVPQPVCPAGVNCPNVPRT